MHQFLESGLVLSSLEPRSITRREARRLFRMRSSFVAQEPESSSNQSLTTASMSSHGRTTLQKVAKSVRVSYCNEWNIVIRMSDHIVAWCSNGEILSWHSEQCPLIHSTLR